MILVYASFEFESTAGRGCWKLPSAFMFTISVFKERVQNLTSHERLKCLLCYFIYSQYVHATSFRRSVIKGQGHNTEIDIMSPVWNLSVQDKYWKLSFGSLYTLMEKLWNICNWIDNKTDFVVFSNSCLSVECQCLFKRKSSCPVLSGEDPKADCRVITACILNTKFFLSL